MSIQLVIYLASIADALRIALGFHIAAFGVAAIAFLMATDLADTKAIAQKRKKLSAIFAALSLASSVPLVLIPSGIDIYKIAGVTDQQKAQIDAQGQVVK